MDLKLTLAESFWQAAKTDVSLGTRNRRNFGPIFFTNSELRTETKIKYIGLFKDI